MRQINYDDFLDKYDFVCLHKEHNVPSYIEARKIQLYYTQAIDEEENPEYHTISLYTEKGEMLRELKIQTKELERLRNKNLLIPKKDDKIFWITKFIQDSINNYVEITCTICDYKKIIKETDELPSYCEKCHSSNTTKQEQVI